MSKPIVAGELMTTGRKRLVAGALIAIITTIEGAALADGTVHLKGGGRVKGDIVEYMPGKYVTVKVGGEMKKFEWAEVERVDDGDKPAERAAPSAAPAGGDGTAVVSFRSTEPRTLLSRVTSRSSATATGPGGTATAHGMSWVDLCMAPCTHKMAPGYYELRLSGDGYTEQTRGFTLRPGENKVVATPGSSGVYVGGLLLLSFGIAAAMVGLPFMFIKKADGEKFSFGTPLVVAGVGGTIVGGIMMANGGSKLEPEGRPEPTARAPGVSFRGTF